jgi:hypothetical protein
MKRSGSPKVALNPPRAGMQSHWLLAALKTE